MRVHAHFQEFSITDHGPHVGKNLGRVDEKNANREMGDKEPGSALARCKSDCGETRWDKSGRDAERCEYLGGEAVRFLNERIQVPRKVAGRFRVRELSHAASSPMR